MNRSVFLSSLLLVVVCLADKEHKRHSAHDPITDEKHYDEHGEHNPDFDHEAILGSRKAEDEYDELEPEVAKRRLALLIKRMDQDSDGYVTPKELQDWIFNSFKMLDEEEAEEAFEEQDEDNDDHVTWKEYLNKQYNYQLEEIEDFRKHPSEEHKEILEMVDDDKIKFVTADLNKDGKLSRAEFSAFYHPFDYEHMHQLEMDRVLRSSDKNKDGSISWEEFVGDRKPDEVEHEERQHFQEFDKNKNGKLEGEEIKNWAVPDHREGAIDEATHLMEKVDENKDGKLSVDEMLDNSETLVGSAATDYGKHLHAIREEL